jgi:hypothetical protein
VAIGSGSGSDHALPTSGSDQQGSHEEIHDGSAGGSNTPPEVEVVRVVLSARNATVFQVYENGTKLFDGPDELEVPKNGKRTVMIKAAGFKDTMLTVGSTQRKLQFKLARLPVGNGNSGHPNAGSDSGHAVVPPPPGPDCSFKILDPKSKACVDQYCAKHPEEDKCHLD